MQEFRFISLPPILYVQLKRFRYDPKANAVVKSNKRFEFYSKLDLRQYCADATYTLHSVLGKSIEYHSLKCQGNCCSFYLQIVHSGKANSGHYMAYTCPKADGKWLKFNDEIVTVCSVRDAVDRNFGKESSTTNAYMLVYIKNSHLPQILREVSQDAVVSEELIQAELCKEVKQSTDHEQSFEVIVFTPEKLRMHEAYKRGSNLMDPSFGLTFIIEKETNMGDLVNTLGVAFSLDDPNKSIALWLLDSVNDTVRPCDTVANSDKTLSSIFKKDRVRFFVEILNMVEEIELCPFDKSKHAIIFIREHDSSNEVGKLSFFGHRYFRLDQTMQVVQSFIENQIGCDYDGKSIALIRESGSEDEYECELLSGNTKISKIVKKRVDTHSAKIVFEFVDENHEPKFITEFGKEAKSLLNRSNKEISSASYSVEINVTIRCDTNHGNVLFSRDFDINCVLLLIVQAISEETVSQSGNIRTIFSL